MSGKSQGISISERFQQFCFFTKGSTLLLLEKSRKINFLHKFFIEQHAKLFPFLLMLGEEIKKGTFLEKKGGYFKLSGENILTSILSTFHPFLTLPNNTLKREKGTFFQFEAISSKARKRYLFCGLETFLSKEQKRHLFCGYKQSHQKREKGTFKNK